MKVMTVLGTRPEIIRLSRILPRLDAHCEHVVVHTGQNFEVSLNDIFFQQLGLRAPDHRLSSQSSTVMGQIAKILESCENVMVREKPDRVLLLGDTNSALAAFVSKRLGIPVYHMEAGNRCYDDRVPEEVNRRIIDHSSDVLLPYTQRSRENLLREGIPGERIYVTGNPIKEVLEFYDQRIAASEVLKDLGVKDRQYMLVTLHRAENVDVPRRFESLIDAVAGLGRAYGVPVLCSLHPRTRSQVQRQGLVVEGRGIVCFEPLGLFDFVSLEKHALCVLSDSGTVQEECCLFGVPSVTLRDVTERPETLDVGSNILGGSDPTQILACVRAVLAQVHAWRPPPEYTVINVADTVVRLVLGHFR